MSGRSIIMLLLAAVILFVVAYFFSEKTNREESEAKPTPTLAVHIPPSVSPAAPTSSVSSRISPTEKRVTIYLVAIGDEGKSGLKIGCGDSLVPVIREVTRSTSAVLQASLQALLSLKEQHYGQSGLYNALYQSNLHLDSAIITNGAATVHISGSVLLGGVCDDQRFVEQIRQTVLQFSNIKTANIYINNRTLESYGSEK